VALSTESAFFSNISHFLLELSCQLSMECKRGQVALSVPWGWAGAEVVNFFLKKKNLGPVKEGSQYTGQMTHISLFLWGVGEQKNLLEFLKIKK
jgi:hypothetical protein